MNCINSKLIIEVVHYRFENMVLNEVAHSKGIRIVELQHGLTGRYHIAYNYGSIKNNKCLPDYFFSFSEFWKNEMRLPNHLVKIVSTGFPYYEKKTQNIQKSLNANKILFLSSGTVGDKLSLIAISLNKRLMGSNYEVIYKLHPGEFADWKLRYPELLNSGINVIDDVKVDLYKLFSESIAQVGVYSTAIFEGLGYELKTFILKMGQTEHIQCLLNMNCAILIDSEEDIINNLYGQSKNGIESVNSDFFWSKNASESINRELTRLLNDAV